MLLLIQSDFLNALGWALFDSLWQMGIITVLYYLLAGKRVSAEKKHLLAILSLSGGTLWFLINIIAHLAMPRTLLSGFAWWPELQQINTSAFLSETLPRLSLIYLVLLSILFIRLFFQYRQTRHLSQRELSKAPASLKLFVNTFKTRLGINSPVQLWVSNRVNTPLTLGFFKPMILLPLAAINNLTTSQLEAVLLHELNHIRRHDYLVNMLITFVEITLFFNPFARLLAAQIRKEREHLCDDKVLQFRYDPKVYATALLTLEKNRQVISPLLLAATGRNRGFLLNRIRRIITGEETRLSVPPALMIFLLAVGFMGTFSWFGGTASSGSGELPVFNISTGYYSVNKANAPALPKQAAEEPTMNTASVFSETGVDTKWQATRSQKITTHESGKTKIVMHTVEADAATPGEAVAPAELQLRFVTATRSRDYTLSESPAAESIPLVDGTQPYVPSAAFNYHYTIDTLHPKKLQAEQEKLTRQSFEKALQVLKDIDWSKLNGQFEAAVQLQDLEKLEAELQKTLSAAQLDQLSVELEISRAFKETYLKDEQLRKKLAEFQEERSRAIKNTERLREVILLERLQHADHQAPKVRKVVHL